VAAHADEMSSDVQAQHIALYVNEFTRELGEEGYAAASALLDRAYESGLTPSSPRLLPD
jgi:1,4-dihydroxy-6-naphthoate synthase